MNSYGNFLLDNGNPAKASQLFRKASSINTSSLDYKYNLVRSLAAENKYREAKQLGEMLLKTAQAILHSLSNLPPLKLSLATQKMPKAT